MSLFSICCELDNNYLIIVISPMIMIKMINHESRFDFHLYQGLRVNGF